ncbi:MAG: hypothetical protein R3E08_00930 [Thiotrichaceae bacterium]
MRHVTLDDYLAAALEAIGVVKTLCQVLVRSGLLYWRDYSHCVDGMAE